MKRVIYTVITIIACYTVFYSSCYAQKRQQDRTSKFIYMTSLCAGSSVGSIEYNNSISQIKSSLVEVQQMLGYQFNNYFFMGVTTGIDVWKKTAFIPLCANFSVNFIDRNWSPHFYVNMGYAFKWYVNTQPDAMTRVIHGATPGAQVESGIGVNFKINRKASLLFLFNYKMQQSQIKYSILEGNVDYSLYSTNRSQLALYHFIGIKFSVIY